MPPVIDSDLWYYAGQVIEMSPAVIRDRCMKEVAR